MATISDDDLFEMASLVHGKWAEAFDNLKKVKVEGYDPRICPRPEWPRFHAIRLENAQKNFDKWDALQKRIVPQLRSLVANHG